MSLKAEVSLSDGSILDGFSGLRAFVVDLGIGILVVLVSLALAMPLINAQGFGTIWMTGALLGLLSALPRRRWWVYVLIGFPASVYALTSGDWPLVNALIRTSIDFGVVLGLAIWIPRNIKVPVQAPLKVMQLVGGALLAGVIRTIAAFVANLISPSALYDIYALGVGLFMTTALGILVLAPLFRLGFTKATYRNINPGTRIAGTIGMFLVTFITLVTSYASNFIGVPSFYYALIPITMVMAIFANQFILALALNVIGFGFSYATAFGVGPFVKEVASQFGFRQSSLSLQMFLLAFTIAAWLLASTTQQLIRSNLKISELANQDPVTGLRSRNWLNIRLNELSTQTSFPPPSASLILIDLNDYQTVERSSSQSDVDTLLREISTEISSCIPDDWEIARLDGFRFALLATGLTPEDSLLLTSNQILQVVTREHLISRSRVSRDGYIGIATNLFGFNISQALLAADTALVTAHQPAQSKVQLLSTLEVEDSAIRREHDLRQALDNGEFKLYLQPQVDLKTKEIVGREALSRWVKADGTMVPPDEFIPDMESNGLIRQLGHEILKQVAVVLSNKTQSTVPISINVSARELADESWCAEFVEQLKKYKIPATKITIEVTESAALGISDRLEADLKWLRKRNVGVHLDDFGTGFASIGTLVRIPATALKLDKSFVEKISIDESSREVVAAIAKLAKGLGLETIAEGVETEEQRKILIKCGWTYGQGYLFGKPEAAQ